jgi:hypothetical protein
MKFVELSKRMARDLADCISSDLSDEERKAIADIVRQGLLDASHLTHEEIKEVIAMTHGSDLDKARMVQEEIERKRDLLIVSLTSMR